MEEDAEVLMAQYKLLTSEQQKQVASMVSMFVQHPAQKRQAGMLKGKIKMADDFDAPLQEFVEYE